MRRSGSTLQSQLISAILGGAPVTLTSPSTFARQWESCKGLPGDLVLKCHEFIPEAALLLRSGDARIFYSYRDIRDVVSSISTKYGIPPFSFVHGGAAAILDEFHQWTSIPGIYVSRYEDASSDLMSEVQSLATHLGIQVDAVRAGEIAAHHSVAAQRARIKAAITSGGLVGEGANCRDPATLLHANHIQFGGSGGFRKYLRWYQVAAIEWVCRDWMRESRYAPDYSAWVQRVCHGGYLLRSRINKIRLQAGKIFKSSWRDAGH